MQTDAGELTAGLVVGADGIGSVLRDRLFPDQPGPRYAGHTSWRTVVAPPRHRGEPGETWGRGQVFGTMPLADGRVYWYATANTPPGRRYDDSRDELLRRFGGWHAPIPELITSAAPETILQLDIADMHTSLTAHHRGRVVLIGDAAHAMTPNLGQGGCQAIEDAVVLADLLAEAHGDIPGALATYTATRAPHTAAVVRRSRRMGAAAQWSSPPAVLLRDTALAASGRLLPDAAIRILDGIADHTLPTFQPAQR